MKISRDFHPSTYVEFVQDYAYIVYDDDVSTEARKEVKIELFEAYVPRIYPDDLQFFIREAQDSPLRSLLVISQNKTIDNTQFLNGIDYEIFTDDDVNKLFIQLEDSASKERALIQNLYENLADVYTHREKLRQVEIAQNFFDHFENQTLHEYKFDDEEMDNLICDENLQSELKSDYSAETELLKNTFYENEEQALKEQETVLLAEEENYEAQSNFMHIEDSEHEFAPRALEQLESKETLWSHSMHFINPYIENYDVLQYEFEPCDDPTKPWFYINDCRTNYNTPVDNLPYGRLIVQGNYLKQPSCVLEGVELSEGAEELSEEYQSFETSIAKACHAVSELLVSATKHSNRVYELIKEETDRIKEKQKDEIICKYEKTDFSLRKEDVYRDTVDDDIDDFLMQNSALLEAIGFNRTKLPCYARYQEIKDQPYESLERTDKVIYKLINRLVFPESATLSKDWLMDADEMFALSKNINGESPVSLYTEEPTFELKKEDDFIVIRPVYVETEYELTVGKSTRARTTYELIVLVAEFLSLVSQIDPLPKRPFVSKRIFDEKLALKNLFIPHEIVEECEEERLEFEDNQMKEVSGVITSANMSMNPEYYDIIEERLKEISSRDKYAKAKVVEDYNPGDCAVCNMRFDSYKNHIYTEDHLRNYRNLMEENENMISELQKYEVKYEVIEACNALLHSAACTLAAELSCSYAKAVNAINESLKSIGAAFELDPEDAPRAASPTVKTNTFVHWREDENLRRESILESILTTAESRKSGYKRIKNSAATFLACVLDVEKERRNCIERYLIDQFAINGNNDLTLLNYLYYDYEEEDKEFEKGYVTLKLKENPTYLFSEPGYEKLISIAELTLLIRACEGNQLIADEEKVSLFDVEEIDYTEDAYIEQITSYLTDEFPEINGRVYDEAITKIEDKRMKENTVRKNLKSDSLNVMKIDVKALKEELADVEIGHLPKTDCIINVAKTILEIENNRKLSISEIYNEAIIAFKAGNLHGYSSKIEEPLSKFVETNEIQDLNKYLAVDENEESADSCELNVERERVKLPEFNIFDPLIKENEEKHDQILKMIEQNDNEEENEAEDEEELKSALEQEGAPEIAIANSLSLVDKALIQKCFKFSSEYMSLPIESFVYHTEFDGCSTKSSMEEMAEFSPLLDDIIEEYEQEYVERAKSTSKFLKTKTKIERKVRSNSICSRSCELENDEISLRMLKEEEYVPVFTEKFKRFEDSQLATIGATETNEYFEKIANDYVNQPPPSTVYRLQCNNQNLTASPILSTNLDIEFFKNLLPENFSKLTEKQEYNELKEFIPLSVSEIHAVYAVLSTVFGGFAPVVDISVEFWKSSADAILGSSASICSFEYAEDSYGLNVADIASTTLVALAARGKLLHEKANYGLTEKRLLIQSKQVERCIPADPICAPVKLQEYEQDDVRVVENGQNVRNGVVDLCVGQIYALNGGE